MKVAVPINSNLESNKEAIKPITRNSQSNFDEEDESYWISKRKHPRFKIELKRAVTQQPLGIEWVVRYNSSRTKTKQRTKLVNKNFKTLNSSGGP